MNVATPVETSVIVTPPKMYTVHNEYFDITCTNGASAEASIYVQNSSRPTSHVILNNSGYNTKSATSRIFKNVDDSIRYTVELKVNPALDRGELLGKLGECTVKMIQAYQYTELFKVATSAVIDGSVPDAYITFPQQSVSVKTNNGAFEATARILGKMVTGARLKFNFDSPMQISLGTQKSELSTEHNFVATAKAPNVDGYTVVSLDTVVGFSGRVTESRTINVLATLMSP